VLLVQRPSEHFAIGVDNRAVSWIPLASTLRSFIPMATYTPALFAASQSRSTAGLGIVIAWSSNSA